MRWSGPRRIEWSPSELPCAPRPINGELLSSWLRRVAAANEITLAEMEACVGASLGREKCGAVFDYCPPERWRFAVAALTRVPERWVWVLDLKQHFRAAEKQSFLHRPSHPEEILSGFCPECFREQIASRKPLHLKAEWALAVVTRCLEHHLPLGLNCPWCGCRGPVHFRGNRAVECLECEQDLTVRRGTPREPVSEPLIAGFESALAGALDGKAPHPNWAGDIGAGEFRRLVSDLGWMLTTGDLVETRYGLALVDRIVPGRFAPKQPYGDDLQAPFFTRSGVEREAVVAAMILALRGFQADRDLGVGGCALQKTAQFRPFVEVLSFTSRNQDALWDRIRKWPGNIQDRAGEALRFLDDRKGARVAPGRRKSAQKKTASSNGRC